MTTKYNIFTVNNLEYREMVDLPLYSYVYKGRYSASVKCFPCYFLDINNSLINTIMKRLFTY